MRLPSPSQIARGIRDLRRVRAEGGPQRVRLTRIGHPRGLIFPTAQAEIEIEAGSGERIHLAPEIPVPWPYAWGYRLARRLGLPLVSTLEPEHLRLSIPVPGVLRRRLGDGKA